METQQIALDLCRLYLQDQQSQGAGTSMPFLALLLGKLRSRDIAWLSSSSTHVQFEHQETADLATALQVEAFFKKNPAWTDDASCTEAARLSFLKGESRCRVANRRLRWYYAKPERLAHDLRFYLDRIVRILAKVLGDIDPFLEILPQEIRVTSGATAGTSRAASKPHLKIRRSYETCSAKGSEALRVLASHWGYRAPRCSPTSLNRIAVVPKNWRTHRTIACEPNGALPFQLAFDSYVKGRLNAVMRVDLHSQSLNQRLAREASLGANLSTLDLEQASDTVSYELVRLLFPRRWFEFLNSFRSSRYTGPFGDGEYEKFSSMGNGSTFTIETLVFSAACKAVGAKVFAVYGDDIVIDRDYLQPLLRVLRFLGFIVNQSKSHFDGEYHESCGEHWHRGRSVTPYYLRVRKWDQPSYCLLVNSLASRALPGGLLWGFLLSLVKEFSLPIVPYNEDLGCGIHITPNSAYAAKKLRYHKKGKWSGSLSTRAFVAKSRDVPVYDSRALFLWYLQASRRSSEGLLRSIRTSRYALAGTKYVQRRVRWFVPPWPIPAHLYWWSEDLLGLSA